MKYNVEERKVLNATVWSFLGQLSNKILPPITSMILARIFSPEVFGIVTAITMITSFAEVFSEAGFQKYIVRQKFNNKVNLKEEADVAFWTNLFISLVVWFIIFLFRRQLSDLLSSSDISLAIVIACLQLPISSLSSIQIAINQRNYDFNKIFKSQLAGSIVSLVVTLALSFFGLSYWAIIIGNLCSFIARALILSYKSEWYPSLYYSINQLKNIFSFSIWVLLESLSVWLSSWADSFFVGTKLDDYHLGIYRNSQSMVNGILSIPQYSFTNVLIVRLSKVQDNNEQFCKDFLTFQRMLSYILFPVGVGIFLYRKLAVRIVFGPNWSGAELIVGLWALVSIFRIIYMSLTSAIYISKGKPKISFLLQIIDIIILIPICLYGVKLNFEQFVWLRCIARLAIIIPNLVIIEKKFNIKLFRIIENTIFPLLFTIMMAIIAIISGRLLPNNYIGACIGIVICIMFYILNVFIFARKDFKNIISIAKSLFSK